MAAGPEGGSAGGLAARPRLRASPVEGQARAAVARLGPELWPRALGMIEGRRKEGRDLRRNKEEEGACLFVVVVVVFK